MQEQLSKNRMIVEKDKKGIITCQVTSSSREKKVRTNLIFKKGIYYLKHNSFSDDIPVSIIFKAMGITEVEIMPLTNLSEEAQSEMYATILACHKLKICTQTEALEYIGGKITQRRDMIRFRSRKPPIEEARELLVSTILAHVPVVDFNFKPKAVYLSVMLNRVIAARKDEKVIDDRDYYGNKRIELAGSLISLLFEDLFKTFNQKVATIYDKNVKSKQVCATDALSIMQSLRDTITYGLESTISSGNWVIRRFKMDRQGVTQVLSRLSYISALGMMTRVNSQFEKTRKVSGPRSLQGSQIGVMCPSDTPEGESCGLVKNLALMAHITTETSSKPLVAFCYCCGVSNIDSVLSRECSDPASYHVFVNGNIIGMCREPFKLVRTFRRERRNGLINIFVSIYIDVKHRCVHISSDGGRLCRPYIIVENGKPILNDRHISLLKKGVYKFDDLLLKGLIEYLDVNELNDSFVAMYEADLEFDHTHLEIEPYTLLGVCAGLIPYPHHNQSPRNTYQCAMGKQAMGVLAYNQNNRIDTLGYHLVYPQRPLVKTRTIELIGFEKLPAGHNAVVAVASFTGYDIEDAVILNKASLDRGFGRCMVTKNSKVLLKTYRNGTKDKISGPKYVPGEDGKPPRVLEKYSALEQDGLPYVGAKIQPRQVMINKEVPLDTQSTDMSSKPQGHQEAPVVLRGSYPYNIEKVMVTVTTDGNTLCKLKLQQVRRPEIGDKFSSRHGQKGVVGFVVQQEDMFHTEQGMQPDLVMNPHGFPSRMTLGKMYEFMASKAGAIAGNFNYGTAFKGTPLSELQEVLFKCGYHYEGKDILYNGHTGDPLNAYIFFGPVYYQKLKHMVMDKMHARAVGPRAPLTRQPQEGRSKDGGLRLGEMERDCLVAHGCRSVYPYLV